MRCRTWRVTFAGQTSAQDKPPSRPGKINMLLTYYVSYMHNCGNVVEHLLENQLPFLVFRSFWYQLSVSFLSKFSSLIMGNVSYLQFAGMANSSPLTSFQGAKAAQKRERNAGKNADKGPTSKTKVNEAAKNIICQTCRQTFVSCYS